MEYSLTIKTENKKEIEHVLRVDSLVAALQEVDSALRDIIKYMEISKDVDEELHTARKIIGEVL